ncbi:MAG TPA: hypothetical protein VH593_11080 [Ktedonobacteraceae bacterium]|jgi:hypothetical protein
MSPGATEEAGKAVGSFIDALKTQPLSLALVVMNVLLIGYLYYTETRYSEGRRHAFEKIIEQQEKMAAMLSHCIPADDIRKMIEGLGGQRGSNQPRQSPTVPP